MTRAALLLAALLLPARALRAAALEDLPSAAAAAAPEAPPPSAEDPGKIYYIAPWEVDFSAVPPPPAPGSPEDRADLDALLRWQDARTPEQCAAARRQEDAGYEVFFGEVSPFPAPLPESAEKIFRRVKIDAASVVFLLKEKYERPRPYLRDPRLRPCVEREGSHAYPSGHSAVAWVYAHILSSLEPRASAVFSAFAAQACLNRVIGGVHHPSDTEAGRRLGGAVFEALLRDGEFRGDLERLRGELRAGPGLKTGRAGAAGPMTARERAARL